MRESNGSLEKKRLRDQQRELIGKFATKEVAEELLTSGFSLGGKYVDASAMFCDIRSFTTIAEARDPRGEVLMKGKTEPSPRVRRARRRSSPRARESPSRIAGARRRASESGEAHE